MKKKQKEMYDDYKRNPVRSILKEKKAVCYPGFEEKLTGAQVGTQEVARDGNITTSRGLGTAIPFALELISQLYGEEKAREIQKSIIFRENL